MRPVLWLEMFTSGLIPWAVLGKFNDVEILDNNDPSHAHGGRLDFTVLFHTRGMRASVGLSWELFNDHLTLGTNVNVNKIQKLDEWKRYLLPDDKIKVLITILQDWYMNYGHSDVDSLYSDL